MKFCSVSRSCQREVVKNLSTTKRINSFLFSKRANASMRFMYQSIPSVTIPPSGNPRANFQNLPNLDPPGKFVGQIPGGRTFLGSLILINFPLFHINH